MPTPLSRRLLVGGSAGVAAGLSLTSTSSPTSAAAAGPRLVPFGPLQAGPGDPVALPAGFTYTVVARTGQTTLRGGTGVTPSRPDGAMVVATRTGYRVVQNHEIQPGTDRHPVPHVAGTVYDPGALAGGCTVIAVDPAGRRRSEWVGLSGTLGNCAGGATPWGTWLTCEESEARAGSPNGRGGVLARDHGYVFEVVPGRPARQDPTPIRAWGRFPHEAVVISPDRRRAYLTEDTAGPNGLLYRWTAPPGVRLRPGIAARLGDDAGRLEAAVVRRAAGRVVPDLARRTGDDVGRSFEVTWVAVPDRHARTISTRRQLADGRVTRGRKLEGAWGDDDGGVWFVSSFARAADIPAGATPHDGQLWRLDPATGRLTLRAHYPYRAELHDESPGWEERLGERIDTAFDGPDGVHVSPYGDLVLSEDGDTANHVMVFDRARGTTQAVARNAVVAGTSGDGGNLYSEVTGPCFSPDGEILFLNVQSPGIVVAVRGPWSRHLGRLV